jgi:bifunctional DNA-binding transcriptional regulator/antitoxin component of YhaV-PrlF toxin-antitoxin module
MSTAVVEDDGRIWLPDDVREAAHLEPGQEFEIFVDHDGSLTLLASGSDDEPRYSEEFLAGLDRALMEAREGKGDFFESGDEFLAAIDAEI